MPPKRWDNDERGIGVGDASEHLDGVLRLEAAMRDGGWVAEEPETHLLPNLEREIEKNRNVWLLLDTHTAGVRFDITLEWRRRGPVNLRTLTKDVYALIGSFAESNTHVRSYIAEQAVVFQVTTGTLDGDGTFVGHGHTVGLTVVGPSVASVLGRRQASG